MTKTKQQLAQAKSVATKQENIKLVLKILGYEIWSDPLNYTVVRENRSRYFSTLKLALIDIRESLMKDSMEGSMILEETIDRLESIDARFLDALSRAMAKLGQ